MPGCPSFCTTSSPGLLLSTSAVKPGCPGLCYGLWSTDWTLSRGSCLTLRYVMKWGPRICVCHCFRPLLRGTVTIRKCTSRYRNCKYLSGIWFPRGEMEVVGFEPLVMVRSALRIETRTQRCACLCITSGAWAEDVSLHFGRNRFKSQPCLASNSTFLSLSSWIWWNEGWIYLFRHPALLTTVFSTPSLRCELQGSAEL